MTNVNANTHGLHHALRWALESAADSALAAADWLAQDIDPAQPSAVALVTRPDVPLDHLEKAKQVYKTMRLLGETAADRRMGGRLYLASIAAALVMHGERISRQSDRPLRRALRQMRDDSDVPAPLADLAGRAIELLHEAADETANGAKRRQSRGDTGWGFHP